MYLGIISFQLHTLTCQGVFSCHTPVSRHEAQAGHVYLRSAVQTYHNPTGCFIIWPQCVCFHLHCRVCLYSARHVETCGRKSVVLLSLQHPPQLSIPSPWLLVHYYLLLADKEFMLWTFFYFFYTGKNVATCVWPAMPFL